MKIKGSTAVIVAMTASRMAAVQLILLFMMLFRNSFSICTPSYTSFLPLIMRIVTRESTVIRINMPAATAEPYPMLNCTKAFLYIYVAISSVAVPGPPPVIT